MAVASGALSVMPMNFAGVPLMFRRPRSGFAVWLVALASVQRSEKTRYLIVEIAAEAVGSIHSHSHQVAVPKIGISNDQDGQDSDNSECHSAKSHKGSRVRSGRWSFLKVSQDEFPKH